MRKEKKQPQDLAIAPKTDASPPMPFDIVSILRSFGAIPEFEEGMIGEFRVVNHDLINGHFTIASDRTGSIDYALLFDKHNTVARRTTTYVDPGKVWRTTTQYWSDNYQNTYSVFYDEEQKADYCSVEIEYAESPHMRVGSVRFGHILYRIDRNLNVPIITVDLSPDFAEDFVRQYSQQGSVTTISVGLTIEGDDPISAKIRFEGEDVALQLGKVTRISDKQLVRVRDIGGLVEYVHYERLEKGRRRERERLLIPTPGSVSLENIGNSALLKGRDWVDLHYDFPVTFLAKPKLYIL